MDRFEQRVVLKFLFLKGLRYKAAQTEPSSVLGEQAYSLSQAKRWIRRFKDSNISCNENDDIFRSTQIFGPRWTSREEKSNQDHFLAAITPELSRDSSNSKRRFDKKEQTEQTDNSMCHNWRKIQEYFVIKQITRALHPVSSLDLSPCDVWFFGYVKE
jgi:hypothetical protein